MRRENLCENLCYENFGSFCVFVIEDFEVQSIQQEFDDLQEEILPLLLFL